MGKQSMDALGLLVDFITNLDIDMMDATVAYCIEKYCWRLFNLASLNISKKVKFTKYKGTLNIRDLQYLPGYLPAYIYYQAGPDIKVGVSGTWNLFSMIWR